MNKLDIDDITRYVESNIGNFHEKRIESLKRLKLSTILKRKNPYLYRAKNVTTTSEIVNEIVDAHVSSSEEGIFGDWLEGLAIFINGKVYGGKKSGIKGIDLEFDKEGKRYLVNIKSGPNWANSSQIAKMKDDFKKAKVTLRTSNSRIIVVAVNGCCYGIDRHPDKGDYFKWCGKRFWHFISGDEELYTKIIQPLGYRAKEKNEHFMEVYNRSLNKFVKEFSDAYCNENGEINWQKLIKLNSSTE